MRCYSTLYIIIITIFPRPCEDSLLGMRLMTTDFKTDMEVKVPNLYFNQMILQTANCKLQTANCKLQTANTVTEMFVNRLFFLQFT